MPSALIKCGFENNGWQCIGPRLLGQLGECLCVMLTKTASYLPKIQNPKHEEIGLKEKSMRGGRVPALLCWKDRTRDCKRVSQGAYPKRRPWTIILVNNAKVWINKCRSLTLSRATWRLEVIQHTSALTREWGSKKVPNQRPNPLKGRGRDIKARAKVPNGGKNYMVANENSTYQWKSTRFHCMRCLRMWWEFCCLW